MYRDGTERRRPDVIGIPRQRGTDQNGEEIRKKVPIDRPYMERQRLLLLRDAEQARVKARERANVVKLVWIHDERATNDEQRIADTENPEVVDAYGGSRAAADPLYKKYASENTWLMTRSQTMAMNLICEQNKEIIEQNNEMVRLLRKIAGEPERPE